MTEEKKDTLFGKFYNKTKQIQENKNQEILKSNRIKYLIFALTLIVCSVFFTFNVKDSDDGIIYSDVHPGDKWSKQSITAQFSFPLYKDSKIYNEEVAKAVRNTLPVFTQNEYANNMILSRIDSVLIYNTKDFSQSQNYFESNFSPEILSELSTMTPEIRQKTISQSYIKLKQFFSKFSGLYLIDTNLKFLQHELIALYIPPNIEKLIKTSTLIDLKAFNEKAKTSLLSTMSGMQLKISEDFIKKNFVPNIVFSPKLTEESVENAKINVAKTDGFVKQGEDIISKGEIISEKTAKKIKSYEKFYYNTSSNNITFWVYLGNLGHATIIFSILIIYLIIIRKKIYSDNIQVAVLSGTVLLVAAVSWLTMQIKTTIPIEYFIFLPGLSMLVAIAFDSRTAFYVTVTMALMLAGVRGNDYDTGTAMMFSGILAAYSVRDIQSRTQLFRSILFIMIGFAASILAFSFERNLELMPSLVKLFVAFLNSAISPLITFGLLFILEKFTNLTTDLKLEEYSNLNHPLLVKLSELAPGSYQHTVSMALMAEKCANAIGANALLSKVGAYFHDIGKLQRPEYFAENQINIENKHDLLSPRKSAESIKSHVLDGIKLAHEYHLPQRIVDFIPMHHGTTSIKHFYAKAVEEAHGESVDIDDFRYPGPKPNTKETAIVMICDSAEAISRVTGKTKEEIDKIIDNTIQARILDGQFSDCNITMKELENIKSACVKYLYGAQHQRVEYKDIPPKSTT